jgi:tungstate transport system substrate-binding protein
MKSLRPIAATLAAAVAFLLASPCASAAEPVPRLRLATTTSTENTGLLGALIPPFERKAGCKVDVIAVGTGKAVALGEAGDVDVLLVHDRPLEERFVASGHGTGRRDVMHNDFVVLGPKEDPAGVAAASGVADAMARIASRKAPFVSRGDRSGTHARELALWKAAKVDPKGAWYVESGLGMGEAISMATQMRAYTLSDRGTAVAWRAKTDLVVLFQGDPALHNPYGVVAVDPAQHPGTRHDLARAFIDYLTGTEGQELIAGFRVGGEPLFFPDARPGR